ncbi:MAG: Re/Si-specific NAD(P)(+) transhydrogenase subunit alpha [Terriglobia bacterium]
MSIQAGIPKETDAGEKRVAVTPETAQRLAKLGVSVLIEPGAGAASGMPDEAYTKAGAFVADAARVYTADIVLRVHCPSAEQIGRLKQEAILVSFIYQNQHHEEVRLLCERKVTVFAMELVPRITRAQSLDALSSQAMVSGYRAVLLAAQKLERFFPMLTTAAGTIRPAKVLVVGAGVAGLQAIATARRLGAQVEAYDVRAASREEVESLGARFVDTGIRAEGQGGYARELTSAEKESQQEVLARHVRQADVVICTANIPGRSAPKIILKPMVDAMKPGAVIVDLAAETGGNCELTQPGVEVKHGAVTVSGPLNLASALAEDASRLYAENVFNLVSLLVADGEIRIDWNDEVVNRTALAHCGEMRPEIARKPPEGAAQP